MGGGMMEIVLAPVVFMSRQLDTPHIGYEQNTIYTGSEFKKHYGEKFYKVTNSSENHFGFQYKNGLNVDVFPFANNKVSGAGLHFTYFSNIHSYYSYGCYIREIEIPDDALVCVDFEEFKANKIILKNKYTFKQFTISEEN